MQEPFRESQVYWWLQGNEWPLVNKSWIDLVAARRSCTINNQLRTEADKRNPTVYSKHSFVMNQKVVDTK